jgi:hypothetical protein
LLSTFIATSIIAALLPACGGQVAGTLEDAGTGSDGSAESSSSVSTSSGGCNLVTHTVDPNRCEPQLSIENTEDGTPCGLIFVQPCVGEAGAPMDCEVCKPYQEGRAWWPGPGACYVTPVDGGFRVSCGGCCGG